MRISCEISVQTLKSSTFLNVSICKFTAICPCNRGGKTLSSSCNQILNTTFSHTVHFLFDSAMSASEPISCFNKFLIHCSFEQCNSVAVTAFRENSCMRNKGAICLITAKVHKIMQCGLYNNYRFELRAKVFNSFSNCIK